MTCGVRAPHTLQNSGLGGLDASGTLWLCYQTVLAHFQTPLWGRTTAGSPYARGLEAASGGQGWSHQGDDIQGET